jgi:vesicle-associated membrane protein-associated protein A
MPSTWRFVEQKYDTVKPFSVADTNGHAAPIPQFDQYDAHDRAGTPPDEEHHDAPEPERAPSPQPPRMPSPQPQPMVHAIPVPPVTVNIHSPAPTPAPPMPVAVPAPAPLEGAVSADEHDELRARFEEAQAELQRMRALLQAMPDPSLARSSDERSDAGTTTVGDDRTIGPSELRRRTRVLSDARSDEGSTLGGSTYGGATTVGSSSTYGDDYKIEVPEGVPLQIVIMVALGVFVSTYLFF